MRPIVLIAGDAGSMTIAVLVGGSTVATHTAVSIIATAINGTTAMPTATAVTIVGAEVAAEDVINKRRRRKTMVTVATRNSLIREVEAIEDEKAAKRALTYLRRLRTESRREAYREPTHEEILAGLREGMQALKDERDGKDVSGQFRDFKALLNEL